MKTIIKNGKFISPCSDKQILTDVYIDGDRISRPFKADDKTKIIDAENRYILPGLVDLHVHFRDPGFTYKEDILSGSRAAARGGFTTVCCMANTEPAIDSVDTLKYVDERGKKAGYVNLLAVSAMTKELAGRELCDFEAMNGAHTQSEELTGHGICAISEDGKTLKDVALMADVCKTAKALDLPVMDHAEPEVATVARDIELCKKYGSGIHIQHISTAESVGLIREAKSDGIPVTAEATPHHLALSEADIDIHGTDAKMNPPLRTEKDRLAVIEGLLDDTIDIIATDHAPHAEKEKNVSFSRAPNGVVGLETAFPVSYTLLVKSGLMSFNRLVHKMSARPLEILGSRQIGVECGCPANLCVVDTNELFRIDRNNFLSKGKNTPFHGMEVFGKVELTVHNGKVTWDENE